MKTAIYTYYSSNDQPEVSTQEQIRICEEFACKHGMDVIRIYSDENVFAGETTDRSQYEHLLEDARAHLFDRILIFSFDLVAHSVEEHVSLLNYLTQNEIKIFSVKLGLADGIEYDLINSLLLRLYQHYEKQDHAAGGAK